MAKMTNDEKKAWTVAVTDDKRNSGKPIAVGQILIFKRGTVPTKENFVDGGGTTREWYALKAIDDTQIAVSQFLRRDSFKTPRFTGATDAARVIELGDKLKEGDFVVKVAESFYGGRNGKLYLTFE